MVALQRKRAAVDAATVGLGIVGVAMPPSLKGKVGKLVRLKFGNLFAVAAEEFALGAVAGSYFDQPR
jgi:hypothetical protein